MFGPWTSIISGPPSPRRDPPVFGYRDCRRSDDVTDQAQHDHPDEADPDLHHLLGQPARAQCHKTFISNL